MRTSIFLRAGRLPAGAVPATDCPDGRDHHAGRGGGRLVHDGDLVALEGFTHLIPFAPGHEIIRQGRRRLTLARMTPDVVYDQLIGMGCAERLIFSWGGNPGVGSLHRLRDAVEHAWPVPLALEEHSHAGMLWGITGVQREAVLAARRSLVTVEEVVDRLDPRPGSVVLPGWVVTAVAHVPGGAHPSYASGYSRRDNGFNRAWDATSRDRDRFTGWMQEHVLGRADG